MMLEELFVKSITNASDFSVLKSAMRGAFRHIEDQRGREVLELGQESMEDLQKERALRQEIQDLTGLVFPLDESDAEEVEELETDPDRLSAMLEYLWVKQKPEEHEELLSYYESEVLGGRESMLRKAYEEQKEQWEQDNADMAADKNEDYFRDLLEKYSGERYINEIDKSDQVKMLGQVMFDLLQGKNPENPVSFEAFSAADFRDWVSEQNAIYGFVDGISGQEHNKAVIEKYLIKIEDHAFALRDAYDDKLESLKSRLAEIEKKYPKAYESAYGNATDMQFESRMDLETFGKDLPPDKIWVKDEDNYNVWQYNEGVRPHEVELRFWKNLDYELDDIDYVAGREKELGGDVIDSESDAYEEGYALGKAFGSSEENALNSKYQPDEYQENYFEGNFKDDPDFTQVWDQDKYQDNYKLRDQLEKGWENGAFIGREEYLKNNPEEDEAVEPEDAYAEVDAQLDAEFDFEGAWTASSAGWRGDRRKALVIAEVGTAPIDSDKDLTSRGTKIEKATYEDLMNGGYGFKITPEEVKKIELGFREVIRQKAIETIEKRGKWSLDDRYKSLAEQDKDEDEAVEPEDEIPDFEYNRKGYLEAFNFGISLGIAAYGKGVETAWHDPFARAALRKYPKVGDKVQKEITSGWLNGWSTAHNEAKSIGEDEAVEPEVETGNSLSVEVSLDDPQYERWNATAKALSLMGNELKKQLVEKGPIVYRPTQISEATEEGLLKIIDVQSVYSDTGKYADKPEGFTAGIFIRHETQDGQRFHPADFCWYSEFFGDTVKISSNLGEFKKGTPVDPDKGYQYFSAITSAIKRSEEGDTPEPEENAGSLRPEDETAIAKIENTIASKEKQLNFMKAANKVIRKYHKIGVRNSESEGWSKYRDAIHKINAEQGDPPFNVETLEAMLKPDFANRIGFPSYQLTSINGKLKRLYNNLETLKNDANARRIKEPEDSTKWEKIPENEQWWDSASVEDRIEVIKGRGLNGSESRAAAQNDYHWWANNADENSWARMNNAVENREIFLKAKETEEESTDNAKPVFPTDDAAFNAGKNLGKQALKDGIRRSEHNHPEYSKWSDLLKPSGQHIPFWKGYLEGWDQALDLRDKEGEGATVSDFDNEKAARTAGIAAGRQAKKDGLGRAPIDHPDFATIRKRNGQFDSEFWKGYLAGWDDENLYADSIDDEDHGMFSQLADLFLALKHLEGQQFEANTFKQSFIKELATIEEINIDNEGLTLSMVTNNTTQTGAGVEVRNRALTFAIGSKEVSFMELVGYLNDVRESAEKKKKEAKDADESNVRRREEEKLENLRKEREKEGKTGFDVGDTVYFFHLASNSWKPAKFRGILEGEATVVYDMQNWTMPLSEFRAEPPEEEEEVIEDETEYSDGEKWSTFHLLFRKLHDRIGKQFQNDTFKTSWIQELTTIEDVMINEIDKTMSMLTNDTRRTGASLWWDADDEEWAAAIGGEEKTLGELEEYLNSIVKQVGPKDTEKIKEIEQEIEELEIDELDEISVIQGDPTKNEIIAFMQKEGVLQGDYITKLSSVALKMLLKGKDTQKIINALIRYSYAEETGAVTNNEFTQDDIEETETALMNRLEELGIDWQAELDNFRQRLMAEGGLKRKGTDPVEIDLPPTPDSVEADDDPAPPVVRDAEERLEITQAEATRDLLEDFEVIMIGPPVANQSISDEQVLFYSPILLEEDIPTVEVIPHMQKSIVKTARVARLYSVTTGTGATLRQLATLKQNGAKMVYQNINPDRVAAMAMDLGRGWGALETEIQKAQQDGDIEALSDLVQVLLKRQGQPISKLEMAAALGRSVYIRESYSDRLSMSKRIILE